MNIGLIVEYIGTNYCGFQKQKNGITVQEVLEKAIEDATAEKNNALLLKNLADKEDRTAYFLCTVAMVYPDGREIVAEGRVYGEITQTHRGKHGFGYDPIFLVEGDTRTLAELTDDEKNAISHRGNALKELLKKI